MTFGDASREKVFLTQLFLSSSLSSSFCHTPDVDGYSMADIKYKWKSKTAVGLDDNLILPQFKVVGYDQREKTIALSTGEKICVNKAIDEEGDEVSCMRK